jgi:glucose-1-phosphate thymidylyltransferase
VEILIEEAQSDNQKKGAVGAVRYWIKTKNLQEDLIVIASDNYFDLDLTDMLKKYNGHNVMIAVYDVGDKQKACETGRACQVGLVTLKKNRVIRLDEKPPEATSSIIATGIYILPSRIFPTLELYCREGKCDNLGSFISYLLNHDEVHAYPFSGTWMDIGDEILRGRVAVEN